MLCHFSLLLLKIRCMKRIYIIALLFSITFQIQIVSAQISAGPMLGANLSRLDDFSVNKQMMRHGLYAGLYGKYQFNDWFSAGLEVAWSEKSVTFTGSESYSALKVLQDRLSMVIPGFPDIKDILDLITGSTGIAFSDSVYETSSGLVSFQYIEVPVKTSFRYKKFSFDAGGYVSYLAGASTEETLNQDIPLFDMIPPSSFDQVIPFLSGFIYSTFPALKEPVTSVSTSVKDFQMFDYGLTGGFSYYPDQFLTLSLSYSHGLANNLSPSLPKDRNHSVIRFSVTYNIFGKVTQKSLF
jgi:hypothetical protein